MAAKKKATGASTVTKQVGESSSSPAEALTVGAAAQPKEPKRVRLAGKYLKFEPLEARQKQVARVTRGIYANLPKIASALIELALKGNTAAAKFLVDFAGIEELPGLGETEAESPESAAAASTTDSADDDPTKAVLSFYKKLDMKAPKLKPPKAETIAMQEAAPAVLARQNNGPLADLHPFEITNHSSGPSDAGP
jgi:hypothetical protein